ncbi:TPA: DUF2306 domain-containing protein [Bacillus thuringiensis]|uniref:DUF2306 domain-containing protein n=3 Tax=Bacillus cereus group TaxID=86661 RepID=A0A9X6KW59_BACTU|nr:MULTISPECIES: DUF2306 domain-containing protein [Bacillus]CKH24832.1 Predicted membrane protein (DUF2306) [Streptococcus pneumoniae]AGE76699.1 hypothetical protein HD73_1121 [Bacillus thuringiensis serovar kurstaki str. HD73]AHZ49870.1 hypothetical protein YBT1520_05590 [Bacillus thuringiensis serovar kurstaki str. YBT-1520]AIE32243.1 hypothetical protein BTK_05640 [Bacillus thuringiensis serovar kurstaki str. HD-1]AIM33550.1 hypothetical protein DF16_orf05135 [Bacillus thuringiensis serova
MNRKIWFVVTCFAFLVASYIVVQYFIMDGFQTGLVKVKLMFGSKLSAFWYMMLFIHITTSIVALVIGPFTLSTRFRERNINRHRIIGRIYMVGILLGGVSGLYLSFYATGGLVAKLGFGLLSVFWLTSAYQALHGVKNKKIKEHRNWMIRNYSLTFGAVTLRIWLPLFIVLFGIERFELSYAIIAWLAWVPNLIVAELFIRKRLNKGKYKGNEDLHF